MKNYLYLRLNWRALLLLLSALSIALCVSGKFEPDTQAVGSSSAITYTVMNTSDSGAGSLRQAILDANANPGTDTIAFSIGSGVQTISPLTPLPIITDPVVIDGSTQPGFAGTPLIVIAGNSVGGSGDVNGLYITAGGSTVRSLAINSFGNIARRALRIDTNGGNTIRGCYLGVDPDGVTRRNNYNAIIVFNSSGNLIGGATPAERNVITGSNFQNIMIVGASSNNEVRGNFIGTNAAGTASLSAGSSEGIDLSSTGTGNIIRDNLISGNGDEGIVLGSIGSIIRGNIIGLDVTGTVKVPNASSGIVLSGSDCLIGGTTPEERNIISGNGGNGINAMPSELPLSQIQGNYIGTDITGSFVLGNFNTGINVFFTTVIIGGTVPGSGNVISGNGGFGGIHLSGSNPGSTIQGNFIGTDATGTFALSGNFYGIEVSSSNNLIGGTQPRARNVISGNSTGIQIGGSTTAILSGNTIQGNHIGTDVTGTRSLPNTMRGISISAALNTTIGGTGLGAGNLIAFNNGAGVAISSSLNPSTGNVVSGNSIFLNTGLGIDLVGNGVTGNDVCDTDMGANNLQNFPVLTGAVSNGGTTTMTGTLNSNASSTFTIEFFASPTPDAGGFGEGKVFLGSTTVTTDGACAGNINATLMGKAVGGMFITATATNATNNTSEFSAGIRATGTSGKTQFDFDGDSKADLSVFRPAQGAWYILQSSNNDFRAQAFGSATDKIVPADYDGDDITDVAVFRDGIWYFLRSSNESFDYVQFGVQGDAPAPGDYDGDGKADFAVFRPSTGIWYVQRSSNSSVTSTQFGTNGDAPVVADYDGDGKADIAVWRPATGTWYLLRSTQGFTAVQFGASGDKPAQGDYDGDGKTDEAVYRPSQGTWYILRSQAGFNAIQFGIATDIPVAADYDGDGKFDVAVYRDGIWYVLGSTAGFSSIQFGAMNDTPVPAAYVP